MRGIKWGGIWYSRNIRHIVLQYNTLLSSTDKGERQNMKHVSTFLIEMRNDLFLSVLYPWEQATYQEIEWAGSTSNYFRNIILIVCSQIKCEYRKYQKVEWVGITFSLLFCSCAWFSLFCQSERGTTSCSDNYSWSLTGVYYANFSSLYCSFLVRGFLSFNRASEAWLLVLSLFHRISPVLCWLFSSLLFSCVWFPRIDILEKLLVVSLSFVRATPHLSPPCYCCPAPWSLMRTVPEAFVVAALVDSTLARITIFINSRRRRPDGQENEQKLVAPYFPIILRYLH